MSQLRLFPSIVRAMTAEQRDELARAEQRGDVAVCAIRAAVACWNAGYSKAACRATEKAVAFASLAAHSAHIALRRGGDS